MFYSYLLPSISSLSPIPTPFLGIDCKAVKGIYYNIRSECSNLAGCKRPMVKYSEGGLNQCVMILLLVKLSKTSGPEKVVKTNKTNVLGKNYKVKV